MILLRHGSRFANLSQKYDPRRRHRWNGRIGCVGGWTGDSVVTEPQVVYARKQLVALNLVFFSTRRINVVITSLLIGWSKR